MRIGSSSFRPWCLHSAGTSWPTQCFRPLFLTQCCLSPTSKRSKELLAQSFESKLLGSFCFLSLACVRLLNWFWDQPFCLCHVSATVAVWCWCLVGSSFASWCRPESKAGPCLIVQRFCRLCRGPVGDASSDSGSQESRSGHWSSFTGLAFDPSC